MCKEGKRVLAELIVDRIVVATTEVSLEIADDPNDTDARMDALNEVGQLLDMLRHGELSANDRAYAIRTLRGFLRNEEVFSKFLVPGLVDNDIDVKQMIDNVLTTLEQEA